MKYIDVRLRIPINKMGLLVELLPEWAAMVGYDKLAQIDVSIRTQGRKVNGEYKPGKGTAAEAVLRVLTQPLRRFEIIKKLEGKQKEKAVNSAVYGLAAKKLIVRQADGSYVKP